MAREVPPDIVRKWKGWLRWSAIWSWTHYLMGFTSAGLGVVIAMNTKSAFLSSTMAVVVASVAAGLALLVTGMGAQTKAKGFELAARELEGVMSVYLHDVSVERKTLGEGVKTGNKIMNDLK